MEGWGAPAHQEERGERVGPVELVIVVRDLSQRVGIGVPFRMSSFFEMVSMYARVCFSGVGSLSMGVFRKCCRESMLSDT